MFDIGFFELLLVGIVGLVVVGPERLPDAVRTTARWWSGIKRTLTNAREELEREVGADDIRRELHNERIMRELEESRREMEQAFTDTGDKPAARARGTAESTQAAQIDEEREFRVQHQHESTPEHPTVDADEYMPEQDDTAEDLVDPEYPEHWHDHGDPELNEDHPERVAQREMSQGKDSQS